MISRTVGTINNATMPEIACEKITAFARSPNTALVKSDVKAIGIKTIKVVVILRITGRATSETAV